MDPWFMFCPHFLGVKGLISIPRKVGCPFSEDGHSQKCQTTGRHTICVAGVIL